MRTVRSIIKEAQERAKEIEDTRMVVLNILDGDTVMQAAVIAFYGSSLDAIELSPHDLREKAIEIMLEKIKE